MKNTLKKIISITVVISMFFGILAIPSYAEEKTGTFTAVAMNVDGLPQKIIGISLNADGPGSEGTKAISSKMATYGWDIIGVSEDFNYNTELMSSLSENYNSGTHRGGVSWFNNDTDGLNLIWKKSISVTGESWTVWNDEYSTGIGGNGADNMIEKGFRYYQATIADGVSVDVYILHMDAASDAGDIEAREKQLTQLRDAIKASNNKNPIIVMGDTNCRYTRESLQTIFIDGINADSRFTIQDAWIEKVRNGSYPEKGADALVAVDKGGTYEYPEAEIVDKIFYINNTESEVQISAKSYTIATDFTNESGTALADHWPVVVEFEYSTGSTECQHNYVENRVEATCTTNGSITYTCDKCADSYSETIAATGHDYKESGRVEATCTTAGSITYTCNYCKDSYSNVIDATGHNYVDGVCTNCGEKDPDYNVEEPSNVLTLGNEVNTITSGNKYVLALKSTSGVFAMGAGDNNSIDSLKISTNLGTEISSELVWTVNEANGKYTISTEIDGKTYYVARTKSFTGYGYKTTLQEDEYYWYMTEYNNGFRFYDKLFYNTKYYLRYYNARQGWIATTRAATLTLFEVEQ